MLILCCKFDNFMYLSLNTVINPNTVLLLLKLSHHLQYRDCFYLNLCAFTVNDLEEEAAAIEKWK